MNQEVEILDWPLAHLPRARLHWADLRWNNFQSSTHTQSRSRKMAKKSKTPQKVKTWTVALVLSVPDKDKAGLIRDLEELINKYARTSTLVITPEVVPNGKGKET